MSGTTAISSFSMVEADLLEAKYILKHLRKLCVSSTEFLHHIAPDAGTLEGDASNIDEMQKPDSSFTEDYRDFDDELNVHLKHFRTEANNYVHVRAINRTLFGPAHDASAAQSGLDLMLYLTNVLVFAKQMIHSHRNDKEMWNSLRQLDNVFPSQFMHSLIPNGNKITSAGESALLIETFELALELRTQLAILVLEHSSSESDFNPDEDIGQVFLRSEAFQDAGSSIIRGWNMAALGDDDSPLPQELENKVIQRLTQIRESFLLDDDSLERGEVVDLEGLARNFPWDALVLRLLHWARLRHRELRDTMDEMGGASAIVRIVKQQIQEPQTVPELPRATSVANNTPPRRKRASFGRDRRRVSRKFDPHAPVDLQAIDAFKARERLSEATTARPTQDEEPVAAAIELNEEEQHIPTIEVVQDDYQPIIGEEEEELPIEQPEEAIEEIIEEEVVEEEETAPEPAGPPKSSAALLQALKEVSKPEKENRATSIFDRQNNAQRVEFGDGFDTQPTPGPSTSTRDKGKQRVQPSPSKKRARPIEVEDEDDSEDDAFETAEDGTARAQARRQKAPVTKKVRIDPTSSAAAPPTSHQPPPRRRVDDDSLFVPTQEESVSETEAPDMTEEPPASSYQAQRELAKQARTPLPQLKQRKAKTAWTTREENALIEYMEMFPSKFSAILSHDRESGDGILQERDQVALKDKVRYMARDMIK